MSPTRFGPTLTIGIGLLLALVLSGCAGQRKFNATAPVVIRSEGIGSAYEQDGELLDESDLVDKLGQNPATESEIHTAGTLGTISVVLAGAGGALVGWPIGAAIAGSKDPKWLLAGIGAGLVLVAIPIGVEASAKTRQAVRIHNRRLESHSDETTTESKRADASAAPVSHQDTRKEPVVEPSPPQAPW